MKECQSIVECFKKSFNNYGVSVSNQQAKDFFNAIEQLVRHLYTTPLSMKLQQRAQYESRMIRSIQKQLKRSNIIIRPTDKSKVFHLGSAEEYHRKALEYMSKTNAYQEIISGINPCMDHLRAVLALIDPLLKTKTIDLTKWKQTMRPDIKTIELAHLYFIPKPHKIGTPLRPIVSSIKAAAKGVSHFLDLILRPLYNQVAKSSTFINDIDFVRQLEQYRNQGYFRRTTSFVTFDVSDLYTMIPRDGALCTLGHFLRKNAIDGQISHMNIDIIMHMARLVMDTNCFAFENKYYQQIRGGAMGSPFTMTLANIYMFEWEQPLIEYQKSNNELYGRYIDDVFMTTNSLSQISIQLNRMEKKDPNIQITISMGKTIEFLDVSVTNDQGQLKTNVYHKPAAEPYILPFLSEHPRHIHANTMKGALYRAARLCSHVEDFDDERRRIEMTLLLNGYPLKFINYHFKTFFHTYNATSLLEQLNHTTYELLHQNILNQLSRREREQQQSNDRMKTSDRSVIRVDYTYESGPMLKFKKELLCLWKKHYMCSGSPMNHIRLQVGTRMNKSLSQILVHKKPPRNMLINNS